MSFDNIMLLTLSEQIANHIKQRIIDGELKPGEKLPPEKDLIEIFNVSRPTLRDAIKSLNAVNIIVSKPGANGGHFVSDISFETMTNNFGDFLSLSLGIQGITLEEVIEVRNLIEKKAVYLSAERRTEEDLKRFENIINSLLETTEEEDYINIDFDFHRHVAYSTRNRLIIVTVEAIIIALRPLFRRSKLSPHTKYELAEEITRIYKAIKEQNPELAKQEMLNHLNHFEAKFKDEINLLLRK